MIEKLLLMFLIFASILFIYWLNKRLNWDLGSEILGEVSLAESAHKQEINELKERVAVLEKIVTDSRYHLNEKINQL